MLKKLGFSLFVAVFVCLTALNVYAGNDIPGKGNVFPSISLPVPSTEAEQVYLGVSGKGTFKISDIKANVVIIEILSMYCPYCQKEAPIVNDLFQLIETNPEIRDKIKLIGIGAGNTAFEIDIFRNQYNIRFPLFADHSYAVHKKVGEVRTPYFFVLRLSPDGSNKIIYSKVGTIHDPKQFLNLILEEAGLKQREG